MLGLYVHIPFCSIKCFYCDFAAFSGQRASAARYLDALEREAALYEDAARSRLRTLYIGGGTPSELTAAELSRLLGGLARRFGPIGALRESTLEANPESLDEEKLGVLAGSGIGRLSLGLQTANDGLLQSIGRRHSFEDFLRVFRSARARGFALNVDLMFGLPGQGLQDHLRSLRAVLELSPEHLSLYGLQVEDRTLFARRGVEADPELGREMMERSLELLAQAGYRHYEISNFALPGHESRHNLNYWRNGPYIGLGCGAAGYLDGTRYQNEERLIPYCEKLEQSQRPAVSEERLSGKDRLGEDLMLGLRLLGGVRLAPAAQGAFRGELQSLLARGLVSLEEAGCSRRLPRLRLSREGLFLANEAFREFVPPYAQEAAA